MLTKLHFSVNFNLKIFCTVFSFEVYENICNGKNCKNKLAKKIMISYFCVKKKKNSISSKIKKMLPKRDPVLLRLIYGMYLILKKFLITEILLRKDGNDTLIFNFSFYEKFTAICKYF